MKKEWWSRDWVLITLWPLHQQIVFPLEVTMGTFSKLMSCALGISVLFHLLSGLNWGHTPNHLCDFLSNTLVQGILSYLLLLQVLMQGSLFAPFAVPAQGERSWFHTNLGHEILCPKLYWELHPQDIFITQILYHILINPWRNWFIVIPFLLASVTNENSLSICSVTHGSVFLEGVWGRRHRKGSGGKHHFLFVFTYMWHPVPMWP